MEGEMEYKHSCRYCKKKFICGRALGGHMRSHMTMPWNETDGNPQKMKGADHGGNDEKCDVDGHHQGGYGLRENPKKSFRFSDSATLLGKDAKVCKECGKGFSSSKALFGHMKCHSERCSQDEESCIEVQNALDGDSDGETVAKKRAKRSTVHTNSSRVCGFDREVEEVAISLMMLSRDTSCFLDFGGDRASKENIRGSSDKSSVSKCKSRFKKQTKISTDFENDGSRRKPFKTRNGSVRTELDASADNEKSGNVFRESTKARFGVGGRKKVGVSTEMESNRESHYEAEGDHEVFNSELDRNSSKMAVWDLPYSESEKHPHKRLRIGAHTSSCKKQKPKAVGYECTSCKKLFQSYQALGGHRASHKGMKSCHAKFKESENNSTETNVSWGQDNETIAEDEPKDPATEKAVESGIAEDELNAELEKGKRHECPVCFKIFRSGQALGGHRRSHMLSNGSSIIVGDETNTIMVNQKLPSIENFLDLNLPAPDELESNEGHSGSSSWLSCNGLTQSSSGKEGEARLISEIVV